MSWDLQRVRHSMVFSTIQRRSPDFALIIVGWNAKELSSEVWVLAPVTEMSDSSVMAGRN
jgi:hypothetical protein